jgi:hypothetical protein
MHKIYRCLRYPGIIIGSAVFVDRIFETDDPKVQEMIEASNSFKAGLIEVTNYESQPSVEPPALNGPVAAPAHEPMTFTKSQLLPLKVSQLRKILSDLGGEPRPEMIKTELIDAILSEQAGSGGGGGPA